MLEYALLLKQNLPSLVGDGAAGVVNSFLATLVAHPLLSGAVVAVLVWVIFVRGGKE